ncbi:PIN domain-containing protein [Deferrisoma sp.]
MIVVLDTNVWVSGVLWTGAPWRVVRLAERGDLRPVATPSMMDELAGVLGRPRFEPRLRQLGLTPPAVLASVLRLVTLVPDPPGPARPSFRRARTTRYFSSARPQSEPPASFPATGSS